MAYNTFDAIKIGLASPDMIKEWSHGLSKKARNHKLQDPQARDQRSLLRKRSSGRPRTGSVTAENIKRYAIRARSATAAASRSQNQGQARAHGPRRANNPRFPSGPWGIPSRMGLILNLSPRLLEKVLYFASYIVINPGDTPLTKNQILTEREYRDMQGKYEDDFKAGMGAEAIKELLAEMDLEAMANELGTELKASSGQR